VDPILIGNRAASGRGIKTLINRMKSLFKRCSDAVISLADRVNICMKCGRDLRKFPFSCKSYFCLSCAKKYVYDSVCQVSAVLHPVVVYRHMVLTIPEQLRCIFYKKRHDVSFFACLDRSGANKC